jgi:hypothetical protein
MEKFVKEIKLYLAYLVYGIIFLFVINEAYRWAWREYGHFRFENQISYFSPTSTEELQKNFPLGTETDEVIKNLENIGAKCEYSKGKKGRTSDYYCSYSGNIFINDIRVFINEDNGKTTDIKSGNYTQLYI